MNVPPVRQAVATIYAIEADLLDVSTRNGNRTWTLGRATIRARVDRDGSDYVWIVADGRQYTVGTEITVTVPT